MEEKWSRFKSLKHYIKCKRAAKKARKQALIWSVGGDSRGAILATNIANDCDKIAKEWKRMVIFGK